MWTKLLLIAVLAATGYSSRAAASTNDDLFAVYPQAQRELIALVSCRSKYISKNLQSSQSSEKISNLSAEACDQEAENFYRKIGKRDVAFSARLDALIAAKVSQIRTRGLPNGPGPDWANCVLKHLVVPTSRLGIDRAIDNSFLACGKEEDAIRSSLSGKASPSEITTAVAGAKDALRRQVRQLMETQIK